MDGSGEFVFLLLVFGAIFGGICAAIAQSKGLSTGGFFAVGFFLGIIGVIVAAAARPGVSDSLRSLTPAPSEGWWPDPTGRWDDRYFNGRFWTPRVGRRVDKATFEDPI